MFQVEYAEQICFAHTGYLHRRGQRYYLLSSEMKLNSCGQTPACLKYTSCEAKNQSLTTTHLFVAVALACHTSWVFLLPLKSDKLKAAVESWNDFPPPPFDV